MTTYDPSDIVTIAVAANLAVLRGRLQHALAQVKQANDLIWLAERNGALGALVGLDALLTEARALYTATCALHTPDARSWIVGLDVGRCLHREEITPSALSEGSAKQSSDAEAVHHEIDELVKLNVLTPELGQRLKDQLTPAVVEQHLNSALDITGLIDLYRNLVR